MQIYIQGQKNTVSSTHTDFNLKVLIAIIWTTIVTSQNLVLYNQTQKKVLPTYSTPPPLFFLLKNVSKNTCILFWPNKTFQYLRDKTCPKYATPILESKPI